MNKRASNGTPAKFANSQHAPEDVRFGEHLIADIYDALAANEDLWSKSVLIITYDEHGGFYDHVVPGAAPNPDGQNSPNPDDQTSFKVPSFAFDRLGLRVPTILASPWIPRGTIENRTFQHASVIKTVCDLFGLDGPLNERDRSAASFADLFTLLKAPRPKEDMPATLDRPPMDDTVVSLAAEVLVDPADEPLDSLTEKWVEGIAALTQERMGLTALTAESVEPLPTTQGDAADFVDRRLREVLGI
jgi:phospholipase C